jgi:hypothetical protein
MNGPVSGEQTTPDYCTAVSCPGWREPLTFGIPIVPGLSSKLLQPLPCDHLINHNDATHFPQGKSSTSAATWGPPSCSQASSSFRENRQVRPSLWAGITPFLAWRSNTSGEICRKSAAAARVSISSFIFAFAPDAIRKLTKFLPEKSCHQKDNDYCLL